LEPAKKPSDYDKPILSSLEERTCQFVLYTDADDDEGHLCPFNGEHWFRGEPYCRKHFRETRYAHRKTRQIEARVARARFVRAQREAEARRAEAQRRAEEDEHRRFNYPLTEEDKEHELLESIRPTDPCEPCVVPGCWELGRHDHERMSTAELVEIVRTHGMTSQVVKLVSTPEK
jgi:hypothetical protein